MKTVFFLFEEPYIPHIYTYWLFVQDTEENENKEPDVSFWRVLKLNKPEWKSVSIASLCSLLSGFCMPLFAVIFGDFIGVSIHLFLGANHVN